MIFLIINDEFIDVTPYRLKNKYRRFGRDFLLQFQTGFTLPFLGHVTILRGTGSIFLRELSTQLPNYTV